MSRLFCSLRINNSLELNTDYIANVNNTPKDTISRIFPPPSSVPDVSYIMQKFWELASF